MIITEEEMTTEQNIPNKLVKVIIYGLDKAKVIAEILKKHKAGSIKTKSYPQNGVRFQTFQIDSWLMDLHKGEPTEFFS